MRSYYPTVYLSKFINIREGWVCNKEIKTICKYAEIFNCPAWYVTLDKRFWIWAKS